MLVEQISHQRILRREISMYYFGSMPARSAPARHTRPVVGAYWINSNQFFGKPPCQRRHDVKPTAVRPSTEAAQPAKADGHPRNESSPVRCLNAFGSRSLDDLGIEPRPVRRANASVAAEEKRHQLRMFLSSCHAHRSRHRATSLRSAGLGHEIEGQRSARQDRRRRP